MLRAGEGEEEVEEDGEPAVLHLVQQLLLVLLLQHLLLLLILFFRLAGLWSSEDPKCVFVCVYK